MVYQKTVREIGSIWFLQGRKTKVKILEVGSPKSLVEILEIGNTSRYKVGEQVKVSNKVLYPRQGR